MSQLKNEMMFDDLKYAQRERLIYLDKCFAWRGMANRSDLIDRFGVSTAQAALDFKTYLEHAKQTPPVYDGGRKTYLAANNHESLFPDNLYQDWKGIISEGSAAHFDELPQLHRHSDAGTVSKLYRAMEDHQAIEIQYISMTTGSGENQWIAPTGFASDGDRIHLRAYSFKHDEHRDYIPVRISENSRFKTRPVNTDLPPDIEWHTWVRIHLVPKSGLSELQTEAVRKEYGFTDETLTIKTRKALEFYANRRWGLDQPNSRLERHSIVVDVSAYETDLSFV